MCWHKLVSTFGTWDREDYGNTERDEIIKNPNLIRYILVEVGGLCIYIEEPHSLTSQSQFKPIRFLYLADLKK